MSFSSVVAMIGPVLIPIVNYLVSSASLLPLGQIINRNFYFRDPRSGLCCLF